MYRVSRREKSEIAVRPVTFYRENKGRDRERNRNSRVVEYSSLAYERARADESTGSRPGVEGYVQDNDDGGGGGNDG